MAYYSNRFLGSGSNGFVNDGTMNINVNGIQQQNLSPNKLVATDSDKNLISVPYPISNNAYISITDRDNLSYSGSGTYYGTFTFGMINSNLNFSFSNNRTITVQTAGTYLISYVVQAGNFGSRVGVATYILINGSQIPTYNPTESGISVSTGAGTATNASILSLNTGDRITLDFQASTNFTLSSICLSMTLQQATVGISNQTLQDEITALQNTVLPYTQAISVEPAGTFTTPIQTIDNSGNTSFLGDVVVKGISVSDMEVQITSLTTELNSIKTIINSAFNINL